MLNKHLSAARKKYLWITWSRLPAGPGTTLPSRWMYPLDKLILRVQNMQSRSEPVCPCNSLMSVFSKCHMCVPLFLTSLMPRLETENMKTRPVVILATRIHSATLSHLIKIYKKWNNKIGTLARGLTNFILSRVSTRLAWLKAAPANPPIMPRIMKKP